MMVESFADFEAKINKLVRVRKQRDFPSGTIEIVKLGQETSSCKQPCFEFLHAYCIAVQHVITDFQLTFKYSQSQWKSF